MTIDEIVIKSNREMALIVLCCRVFLKTEKAEALSAFMHNYPVDWNKVYQLSALHRIRPVMYAVMVNITPGPVLERFHTFCINHTSQAFTKKRESSRIIGILKKQGVNSRLYKGADFAMVAYGDLGLRESSDNDVIIEKKDIPVIIALLEKEGYQMKEKDFYTRFPKQFLRRHKDIVFLKKMEGGVMMIFEFQFEPISYFSPSTPGFDELLGEDHLSSGRPLNKVDYLKLMVINNGTADYYPTLRSVLDIAVIYAGGAGLSREDRFYQLWECLSADLFDLPSGSPSKYKSLSQVHHYVLNHILHPETSARMKFVRYSWFNCRMGKGFQEKLDQFLRSAHFFITPNGNDITGLRLPFHFMYYVTKPVRLVLRALRRGK